MVAAAYSIELGVMVSSCVLLWCLVVCQLLVYRFQGRSRWVGAKCQILMFAITALTLQSIRAPDTSNVFNIYNVPFQHGMHAQVTGLLFDAVCIMLLASARSLYSQINRIVPVWAPIFLAVPCVAYHLSSISLTVWEGIELSQHPDSLWPRMIIALAKSISFDVIAIIFLVLNNYIFVQLYRRVAAFVRIVEAAECETQRYVTPVSVITAHGSHGPSNNNQPSTAANHTPTRTLVQTVVVKTNQDTSETTPLRTQAQFNGTPPRSVASLSSSSSSDADDDFGGESILVPSISRDSGPLLGTPLLTRVIVADPPNPDTQYRLDGSEHSSHTPSNHFSLTLNTQIHAATQRETRTPIRTQSSTTAIATPTTSSTTATALLPASHQTSTTITPATSTTTAADARMMILKRALTKMIWMLLFVNLIVFASIAASVPLMISYSSGDVVTAELYPPDPNDYSVFRSGTLWIQQCALFVCMYYSWAPIGVWCSRAQREERGTPFWSTLWNGSHTTNKETNERYASNNIHIRGVKKQHNTTR